MRTQKQSKNKSGADEKIRSLKEFQSIPGVGKSIALDLWEMGFRSLHDLREKNPEKLYQQFMDLKGCYVDRCLLYVFRCAIYYVSHDRHVKEKLLWWNWKDSKIKPLKK